MRSELEPGCTAIVIGGHEDLGTIVTIGNFIGRFEPENDDYCCPYDDLWEVNKPLGYPTGKYYMCPSHMLQRIDDNETKCLTKPAHIKESP